MAGRPRDWHPVADSDPIPGDPDQVAALGRKLRKTAEELERQIRNLKAVAEVDAWDSKAGKEFREKAKGNVRKLEAAFKRYDTAADALGTKVAEIGGGYQDKLNAKPTNYASDLNRAQEIADASLKDAKDADERKGAAQHSLDGLTEKEKEDKKKGFEEKRDAAGDDITAAREKISQAKEIRDNAAKRAREAIDDVISHDSLKDSFWDKFDDWVEGIGTFFSNAAAWLGVVSLLVGWIPIIGQALAGILGSLAMIATLISTVTTVIQVIRGDKGWTDLALAVAGFAMMGVGKAFSKISGKFIKGSLARVTRAGKAATGKQFARSNKKLRQIAGKSSRLEKGDVWKSMKEPFSELFSKSTWGNNFKALNPFGSGGNYGKMTNELALRGDGSKMKGLAKSFTIADPGVSWDLKSIKQGTAALGEYDLNAVNKISKTASRLRHFGAGVTIGGLALDDHFNPLLK
ncbi:hypothetical protein [Streptomyces sp. NPDC048309]|uniref:hypothetical protein n=1 Tax=Streptomyces sp. NPDC048309 TaxID=3154618 RepID=UPI0033DCD38F